jgi:hypothetical protein
MIRKSDGGGNVQKEQCNTKLVDAIIEGVEKEAQTKHRTRILYTLTSKGPSTIRALNGGHRS